MASYYINGSKLLNLWIIQDYVLLLISFHNRLDEASERKILMANMMITIEAKLKVGT